MGQKLARALGQSGSLRGQKIAAVTLADIAGKSAAPVRKATAKVAAKYRDPATGDS